MAKMIDLGESTRLLDEKDQECEKLKGICTTLLDRQVKDTEIIGKQGKQIETLKKNQDPRQVKAYMEVYTRVKSRKGIEDILTRMNSLNKT